MIKLCLSRNVTTEIKKVSKLKFVGILWLFER